MPLVQISLKSGRSDEELGAISQAVHESMVAILNVPERDQFQLIQEYAPGRFIYSPNYLNMRRTDALIFIHITLSTGRSLEQKQTFYADVVQRLISAIGIRSQDVAIILHENTREDWSFGDGLASYVALPPEEWK
jgi:4-oxalocrotonate tautomerase